MNILSEEYKLNATNKEKEKYREIIKPYIEKFIDDEFPLLSNHVRKIPIEINNNKSSSLGSFRCKNNKLSFTFSGKQLTVSNYVRELDKFLTEIVKHEVIHYVCFMEGEEFDDGTDLFENRLKKYGSSSSESVKKELRKAPVPTINKIYYIHTCKNNCYAYKFMKKEKNYFCGKCEEQLIFKERILKHHVQA